MTIKKDIDELRRKAAKQGFTVTRTGGDHWLWVSPNGGRVISSATPSSSRTIANLVADLRKIGYDPNYVKPKKEIAPVATIQIKHDHEEVESSKCVVDGCGRRFLNHKMADHMLSAHELFWCEPCKRSFKTKTAFGRHCSSTHKTDSDGIALIECTVDGCGKLLSGKGSGLKDHMKKVHGKVETETPAQDEPEDLPEVEAPPIVKEVAPVEESDLGNIKADSPQPKVFDFTPLMQELVKAAPHMTPERWDLLGEWVQTTAATIELSK